VRVGKKESSGNIWNNNLYIVWKYENWNVIGCGLHWIIRFKYKCEMQEWNDKGEKKVKKQKYLKYLYVCCVKFWKGKCDWWMVGLSNR
jgi:hypothetical protein